MSYMKKRLEEMLESLSKPCNMTLSEIEERYKDLEEKLQNNPKHPVYIFRCKMCGEIFHKPAVGLGMQENNIMVHSGWEGPPAEARHECRIEGFSYLSYSGEEPLTPVQGKGDFVGYGYVTDIDEKELDDPVTSAQPPKYIKKDGNLYIEGHEDLGPVGLWVRKDEENDERHH